MARGAFSLFSEGTEDRLGEADSLDEAVRLALALAREGPGDDPVLIEYSGRVVHQIAWTPGGVVEEAVGGLPRTPNQALQQTGRPKAASPLLSWGVRR